MAGVPYTEQSPKTKENDVNMILSSLAYINTDKAFVLYKYRQEGVLDIGGERE